MLFQTFTFFHLQASLHLCENNFWLVKVCCLFAEMLLKVFPFNGYNRLYLFCISSLFDNYESTGIVAFFVYYIILAVVTVKWGFENVSNFCKKNII